MVEVEEFAVEFRMLGFADLCVYVCVCAWVWLVCLDAWVRGCVWDASG